MSVYMCVKKYFFILKKPNPSQLPLFIDGKGKALRKQLSWSDALADKEEFDWQAKCMSETAAAAAATKSLQLCPTLCDPIDGSPPGSAIPGILQARILEWVAISFSNAWK